MEGIRSAGFTTPTPIQAQTIPGTLKGHDVMGLAQTGTGKTAAFVLPMLQRFIDNAPKEEKRRVRGLIISPTRELAEQTRSDILTLGRRTGLRSMSIYGGVSMNPQIQKLQAGVDIIVACPGRLLDHLRQKMVDLSGVEVLVLDEADRMLDMGFMPDIRKILKQVPKKRQTMLFSATMPDDIRKLANDILHKPENVQINPSRPAETVSHALYPVDAHLKTRLLISLLKKTETDSVLVFTRTRGRTKRVASQLQRAGFNAVSLEGGMPQGKRQAALNGFRQGKYQVLVATDIAARGVDIQSISHVINYDVPDTTDSYTHRIGRTGRATRSGAAFTLVTQEDAPVIRDFERDMEVEMVCCELDGFDYNAAAPPARATRPHTSGRQKRRGRQTALARGV